MSAEHQELKAAGSLLSSILGRYLDACLAVERKSAILTPTDLSSNVESEIQFVATLGLKLRKAKAATNQTRNYSTSLASIHTLPQELLARIFLYLFGSRSIWDWDSHPEAVSQVCSRWRNASLGLPSLWRRIILPLVPEIEVSHIIWRTAFASQAYPLSLDLCLTSSTREISSVSETRGINSLINAIAPRIGSLELSTDRWTDQGECDSTLASCLPRCKPGVLRALITYHRDSSGILFDVADDLPGYLCDRYSVIGLGDCDQVLASLNILRLNRLYPFRTSKAYHGLIELHLDREDRGLIISEDHLIGIIRASPALRILEFPLVIVEALPHLEFLSVHKITPKALGILLRWLSLGSKPLQLVIPDCRLTISQDTPWLRQPDKETKSFLARAQVTKFYASFMNYRDTFELLDLCPHLKTLPCQYIYPGNSHLPKRDRFPISHPNLESLLILEDGIRLTPLLDIIGGCSSLQAILFWKCRHYRGESATGKYDIYEPLCASDLEILAGFGPKFGIVDYDPTRDWEIFFFAP